MIKNILLDFISPDNWKTYVTIPQQPAHRETFRRAIIAQLTSSLNISVLLTDGYCLLPPAFILQSGTAFEAIRAKEPFLAHGLIRLPLRETNIDSYIDKKLAEYDFVRDTHEGFYIDERWEFLHRHRNAIISRKASMGLTIADRWENASEQSTVWEPIFKTLPNLVDSLRTTPSRLKERGVSITLEAIMKLDNIPSHDGTRFLVNQAIQHDYLNEYLNEYHASILTGVPPKPIGVDYLINTESAYYDYGLFVRILRKLGVYGFIMNAHPEAIMSLRSEASVIKLKELYCSYCNQQKNNAIMSSDGLFLPIAEKIEQAGLLSHTCTSKPLLFYNRKKEYHTVKERFDKVLDCISDPKSSVTVPAVNNVTLTVEGDLVMGDKIDIKQGDHSMIGNIKTSGSAIANQSSPEAHSFDFEALRADIDNIKNQADIDTSIIGKLDELLEAINEKDEEEVRQITGGWTQKFKNKILPFLQGAAALASVIGVAIR